MSSSGTQPPATRRPAREHTFDDRPLERSGPHGADDATWIVERVMQRSEVADSAPVNHSELAGLVDATPDPIFDRQRPRRRATHDVDSDHAGRITGTQRRDLDVLADEAPVGGLAGWFERTGIFGPARPPRAARTGRTAAITGERTRTHRVVDPASSADRERVEAHTVPVGPARERATRSSRAAEPQILGAVDPLLVRLGVIIALVVLLVPFAFALRPSSDDGAVRSPDVVASGGPRLGADHQVAIDRVLPPTTDGTAATPAGSDDGATLDEGSIADASAGQAAPESGDSAADLPPCNRTYTIHPGDYWLRLADEADVDLADLLAVNGATVETVLHPGDEVCLPRGAFVPLPPTTTTAAPTTVAPTTAAAPSGRSGSSASGGTSSGSSTSSSPSSSASGAGSGSGSTATTRPPTTSAVPTTTAAPRPSASRETPEQVKAIIREVWPEELHERAILVAQRESSLRPGAYNGHCCYGIFQIYWNVHRSWLTNHGVTTSAHLLDARTNIQMAYLIYQRAGGWGPWSQTAY